MFNLVATDRRAFADEGTQRAMDSMHPARSQAQSRYARWVNRLHSRR